jgi:catechol 2,3-dioxygenase-like lactoylglutathione lyase family enzyme
MADEVVTEVQFDDVAPVIPVRDLDAALARYRRLGFEAHAPDGPERYGFANRGSVSLHLTESAGHDPARTGAVVYLYVSDADQVHAEWAAAGVEGHLGAPTDRWYGLREFGLVDPDGTLLRVGSWLRRPGDDQSERRSVIR